VTEQLSRCSATQEPFAREIAGVRKAVAGNLGFSKEDVDRAETVLRSPGLFSHADLAAAHVALNAWRAAHQLPTSLLRHLVGIRFVNLGMDGIVFSRLKRVPTIIGKIGRQSHYPLWEMQDIGGVRAVVGTPEEVRELVDFLLRFPLDGVFRLLEPPQDRMANPKPSGYRSVHLIYAYDRDTDPAAGEDESLDGLRVELQVRTRLQHAWATANEIVGTFRGEDLKSGQGDPDWLRFFTLAGAVIAKHEGLPVGGKVPQKPDELAREFKAVRDRLQVFDTVSAYNVGFKFVKSPELADARFVLLKFSLPLRQVRATSYLDDQFGDALADYAEAESQYREDPDTNIVLISVEKLADVEQAYPNYFVDTRVFLDTIYSKAEVDAIMAKSEKVVPPPEFNRADDQDEIDGISR
jgi:hypothetical protein